MADEDPMKPNMQLLQDTAGVVRAVIIEGKTIDCRNAGLIMIPGGSAISLTLDADKVNLTYGEYTPKTEE